MTKQQYMENDIAALVEDCGYDAVLGALITTCRYWATMGTVPPIEGPVELWAKREQALRRAQREGR